MIKDETVAFAVLKLALEALNTCGEDEWHSDEDFGLMQTYNENLVNYAIIAIKEALAQTSTQCEKQPAQEPLIKQGWDVDTLLDKSAQEPRNFCPRCGKRTADLTVIHTCTPPEGGHQ